MSFRQFIFFLAWKILIYLIDKQCNLIFLQVLFSLSLKLWVKSLYLKQYVVPISFPVFIGFIFDFVFFMFYIGGNSFYVSHSMRSNFLINYHFKYFIPSFSSFNSFSSSFSSLIFLSPCSFIFLFNYLFSSFCSFIFLFDSFFSSFSVCILSPCSLIFLFFSSVC